MFQYKHFQYLLIAIGKNQKLTKSRFASSKVSKYLITLDCCYVGCHAGSRARWSKVDLIKQKHLIYSIYLTVNIHVSISFQHCHKQANKQTNEHTYKQHQELQVCFADKYLQVTLPSFIIKKYRIYLCTCMMSTNPEILRYKVYSNAKLNHYCKI